MASGTFAVDYAKEVFARNLAILHEPFHSQEKQEDQ
jgi:hypothetical protein